MKRKVYAGVLLLFALGGFSCEGSRQETSRGAVLAPEMTKPGKTNPENSKMVEKNTGEKAVGEGKLLLTEEEWKKRLTPEQYRICRNKGTERAFTGEYWNTKTEGTYTCVACGNELFSSQTKFDSGTGWPSFWDPVSPASISTEEDRGLFSVRTEVLCARCGSHLGHVFNDAPSTPTNLRYCINSAALKLVEKKQEND